MLVLGVDRRPGSAVEGAGNRSDTMMVLQIEPDTGQIELLSIPRDLLVEIRPEVEDRINTAYAHGGAEGAEAAVENFTGIQIDNYAVVDFEGFRQIIDAIGGVEVKVEDDLPPRWAIEKGVQTLDGRRALLYARYRGTPGGDLDRIERQQELVAALRSQALRWNTITRLPEIAGLMNENVETDMGVVEAISLGRILIQYGRDTRMTAAQLKGTPTTLPNGNQVLVPDESVNEAILRNFRGQR